MLINQLLHKLMNGLNRREQHQQVRESLLKKENEETFSGSSQARLLNAEGQPPVASEAINCGLF